MIDRFLECARSAIREVVPSVVAAFEAPASEPFVKFDGSFVTETDQAVERHLSARFAAEFPDVACLGEESGVITRDPVTTPADEIYASFMATPYQIVIDPIDGTRNFVNKYQEYCIAAALTTARGDGIWPLAGVVAIPQEGVMYWCDESGVFCERFDSEEVEQVSYRRERTDLVSVNSKDRAWLVDNGYELRYQWRSSGSSVHDFLGTALGRLNASIIGAQRLWDLMAPLAIATRLGLKLVDIRDGAAIHSLTVRDLSPDLEQRPWGIVRKMLLAPPNVGVGDILKGVVK
jgi:myo-inositol-1(or 4)-monophosphatase